MSNVMQFPRRDVAYRYGLLRAAGTEGVTREELIQDGIRYVERMNNVLTEGELLSMIEGKRDRALRQLEDLDRIL